MPDNIWASTIWVPVGIGLGVLGIIIGAALAWWFARGAGLSMQASGTTLVSTPDNERITIHYDGKPIERATQSIVWLWRTGRGVLKGTDVVPSDPLVISVPDGNTILDVAVLRQSTVTNNMRTDFEQSAGAVKQVRLDFDYLDRRQGVAIEVYHTAPNPEAVTISGTVMGIPRGIRTVRATSIMSMPVRLLGNVAVTIPTGLIPRHLRGAGQGPRPLRDLVADTLREVLRAMTGVGLPPGRRRPRG